MVDIFGTDLIVGDIVSFNPPKYKGLKFGKVIGFTAQKVKVAFDRYDSYDLDVAGLINFDEEILQKSAFFEKDVARHTV